MSGCFFGQRRRATRVQPCSLCHNLKAAAALNCDRSLRLSLLRGDREFESPILQQGVSNKLSGCQEAICSAITARPIAGAIFAPLAQFETAARIAMLPPIAA